MSSSRRREQQAFHYESQSAALRGWFTNRRWAKVLPILKGHDEDAISLRLLELLTDARFLEECRRRGVPLEYVIEDVRTHNYRIFDLAIEIDSAQASYRKKFMEPFARQNHNLPDGGRFVFGGVETNVAQLQFMRFLLENSILEWVRMHKQQIFEIKQQLCI
jgi:hypothetical protein